MSQSIFYRLFGLGKIPPVALPAIEKEGVILKQEGLGGSIIFSNFRAPGRYHGSKWSGFLGSIVLTEKHLLAWTWSRTAIGVAWDAEETRKLKCFLKGNKTLCIQYDPSIFNPDWSGQITLSYKTALASKILSRIRKQIRLAGQ